MDERHCVKIRRFTFFIDQLLLIPNYCFILLFILSFGFYLFIYLLLFIYLFIENIHLTRSKNIKTMSWLPQNDILGHSKVKLFFGHGGISGLFESIYHGVPLVIAPFFGDQFANANTAKHIGIAEKVDLKSITADELVHVMRTVMTKAR